MSEKKITSPPKITMKNIKHFNDKLSDKDYYNFEEYKKRFVKYFNKIPENLKEHYNNYKEYFSDSDSVGSSIENLSNNSFWDLFDKFDKTLFEKRCKTLLTYFGTTLRCNRFDLGNCIEYAVAELLVENQIKITEMPNAKRYDINIHGYCELSIKYSTKGNIRLHNSLGENKDIQLKKTLCITPDRIYLLLPEIINKFVKLDDYLENTKDALELKRSILKSLIKKKYPFITNININVEKEKCLHNKCSKIIWDYIKNMD